MEVVSISCGIYKITNKINGHSYIGLSKNIERRFSDHKNKAFNSNKDEDKNKVLYKAFRKYGLDNFNFEIIEECSEDLLKEREIYWIKYYNTYLDKNHYNETPGGDLPGLKNVLQGEKHGMAKLTEEDIIFCRKAYQQGKRSREIWETYFYEKILYSGFLRMWHGRTWTHVMPEVFRKNPHPSKYGEKDCEIINSLWEENKNKMSFRQFTDSELCYVGYGTAWNMINCPEKYQGK
jgi:group I intron endonuclease